jgi:hypothetical protein
VNIIKNLKISSLGEIPMVFDRKVELVCFGLTKCIAESLITISDPFIIELIDSQKVGLGQLFRYLNVLPVFTLVDVQRLQQGFCRTYILETKGMTCKIKETFPSDLFDPPISAIDQKIHIERVNETSTYYAPH